MIAKLRTDTGRELDARASLAKAGRVFQLTFESSGEAGRRNGDYREAFELAIKRLAALRATLHDGRVESRRTRDWSPAEKRLVVDQNPYPVELSTVPEISTFAKSLRAAGAKVGRAGDHGGNPTKRITLDFSLPEGFADESQATTSILFGEPRSPERGEKDPSVNAWWTQRPAERYWLEITGRDDLGADLRAPLTNEHGRPFWSYSLLRWVRAGDSVFHYHRNRSAIVAVSRATETQWADRIIWAARGTSARNSAIKPHSRPGWYVGLENFTLLSEPVSLESVRANRDALTRAVSALKRNISGPLYFPFELSDSRDVRPMQGYLFKLPQSVVSLFPSVSKRAFSFTERMEPECSLTGGYRRADERTSVAASDPFTVDPAIKERALRSHAATQNALADFLVAHGLSPQSSTENQPNFDIAWENRGVIWVAEVKSLTDGNEEKQLRLGLGQILRYQQLVSQARAARAALVTEREPRDKTWIDLCGQLGIVLAWPGNWGSILR